MQVTPQIIEANIAAGNFKEAEVQVNEVLKDRPDSARAHLLKAEILVKEGHLKESQQEYAKIVSLDKTGETVNSPMYKAITQEYVTLNSHQQDDGLSWGIITLLVAIVAIAAWFILRSAAQDRKKIATQKAQEEADRFERDMRIEKSMKDLEIRRWLRATGPIEGPVVATKPYPTVADYALPVSQPQVAYVPTPVQQTSTQRNTIVDTAVGVMAGEATYHAIAGSGEEERARRRRAERDDEDDRRRHSESSSNYSTWRTPDSESAPPVLSSSSSSGSSWSSSLSSSSSDSSSSWGSSSSSSSGSSSWDSSSSDSSSSSSSDW